MSLLPQLLVWQKEKRRQHHGPKYNTYLRTRIHLGMCKKCGSPLKICPRYPLSQFLRIEIENIDDTIHHLQNNKAKSNNVPKQPMNLRPCLIITKRFGILLIVSMVNRHYLRRYHYNSTKWRQITSIQVSLRRSYAIWLRSEFLSYYYWCLSIILVYRPYSNVHRRNYCYRFSSPNNAVLAKQSLETYQRWEKLFSTL